MATLVSLFPHKGDDGKWYPPGHRRVVDDKAVDFYTTPIGHIKYYDVVPEPKKVDAPKKEVAAPKVEEQPVEKEPEAEVTPEPEKAVEQPKKATKKSK